MRAEIAAPISATISANLSQYLHALFHGMALIIGVGSTDSPATVASVAFHSAVMVAALE